MSKRVGIWIRVSTEDQAQSDSPEHHEQRARSYANLKEWNVVEVYHLEAVSGKSVINHPEAQRMLEDVSRGHIEGLIFSKLARLARNTKELLEFADIFQQHNADLTSLDESIDTSSPVGRFFYTLIAAMAEWERAEIGSRIKASVKVRAKLGKSLGGSTPYGYKWSGKKLVLHPDEAPVRKLIHELFDQHRRKKVVAKILKEKGYRTRKGGFFSDSTIDRLLRDPIAKGMRRINYTEQTDNGRWKLKPKEEWVFVEAPRIVSDELWESCNQVLDEMNQKKGKVRSKGIHMFTGVVQCHCGAKMYMRSLSPKYICYKCKNKISPDDLETIFLSQLENFLFSDTEIQGHLSREKLRLKDKEELLEAQGRECEKLKQKVALTLELYQEGEISKEAFREHHGPLYAKQKQVELSMMGIQAEIDAIRMQTLDSSQILYDAQNLHRHWSKFTKEDKKRIVETITESIIVGKEDIQINLSYIPTLSPNPPKRACRKTKSLALSETLQLSDEPMWVCCLFVKSCLRAKRPINPAYPKELVTLGDHLRKVRLDRGLSQPEVAKILKVTTDTVTGWELNHYEPTPKYAGVIIKFLGYFPFNDTGNSLGRRLLLARLASGMTQEGVAALIGCDESTVRYIELDLRKPGPKTQAKIEGFINSVMTLT